MDYNDPGMYMFTNAQNQEWMLLFVSGGARAGFESGQLKISI
jgi:hypothetical protein